MASRAHVDQHELASFVAPTLLRALAATDDERAPPPRAFEAALMLVDVSGFTSFTARHAVDGGRGAEAVCRALSAAFDGWIELIAAYGGEVTKFAGDAILALWPVDEPGRLAAATRSAAACGLALQAAGKTADGPFSARISVACGRIDQIHVGGRAGPLDFFLVGPPLLALSRGQQHARPGEVIAVDAAWRALAGAGEPGPAADLGRLRPVVDLDVPRAPPAPASATKLPALAGLLGATLVDQLAAGHAAWLAEVRVVTALFIHLTPRADAVDVAAVQAQIEAIHHALAGFEGGVDKVCVDEKGVTLLAAFGLPPRAHEDDAARGLRVALALRSGPPGAVPRAIGVATGRVLCGVIGNRRRREYTLIGEPVNLAARLAQLALHDAEHADEHAVVLCDEATRAAAGPAFELDDRGVVELKGLGGRRVLRPLAVRATGDRRRVDMVGRADERARFAAVFAELADGRTAGVCALVGEAGIGKTCLIGHLVRAAEAAGLRCLLGGAEAFEQARPYHPWRPLLRACLDLDGPGDDSLADLTARVGARCPELAPLTALLAPLLSRTAGDDEHTRTLRGAVRAESMRALVAGLLAAAATTRPCVVILEDAHWFDSASWVLLAGLVRALAPDGRLLFIVTTRPDLEAERRLAALECPAGCTRVRLTGLGRGELAPVIRQRLGVAELPPAVEAFIAERAAGNPFFAQEMACALRDASVLRVAAGRCEVDRGEDSGRWATICPATVEGVILGRLDRLGVREGLTLKVAAVIGRRFTLAVLAAAHPFPDSDAALAEQLTHIQRMDLIAAVDDSAEPAYCFTHALGHEVTYGLLPGSQRRSLHRAVVAALTRRGPDAATAAALAHHWSRVVDDPDADTASLHAAVAAFERAGDEALRSGANAEALRLFGEALQLVPRVGPAAAAREAVWRARMAEAELGLGHIPASRLAAAHALELFGRPAPRARLARALAGLWHGVRLLCGSDGDIVGHPAADALELARAHQLFTELLYLDDDAPGFIHAALRGPQLAARSGDPAALARASAMVATLFRQLGLAAPASRRAAVAERLIAAMSAVDALPTQLLLGLYDLVCGRWLAASDRLELAANTSRSIHDHEHWARCVGIRAIALALRGDIQRSEALYTALAAGGHARGNPIHEVWGHRGLMMLALRRGHADAVIDRGARALELLRGGADPLSEILVRANMAAAHLQRGDLASARALADLALDALLLAAAAPYYLALAAGLLAGVTLELSTRVTTPDPALTTRAAQALRCARRLARRFPMIRPVVHLHDARLAAIRGRPRRALGHALEGLAAAEALAMPHEQGLAHLGLAALTTGAARARHIAAAELHLRATDGHAALARLATLA